jgi:hypothetical protein
MMEKKQLYSAAYLNMFPSEYEPFFEGLLNVVKIQILKPETLQVALSQISLSILPCNNSICEEINEQEYAWLIILLIFMSLMSHSNPASHTSNSCKAQFLPSLSLFHHVSSGNESRPTATCHPWE